MSHFSKCLRSQSRFYPEIIKMWRGSVTGIKVALRHAESVTQCDSDSDGDSSLSHPLTNYSGHIPSAFLSAIIYFCRWNSSQISITPKCCHECSAGSRWPWPSSVSSWLASSSTLSTSSTSPLYKTSTSSSSVGQHPFSHFLQSLKLQNTSFTLKILMGRS